MINLSKEFTANETYIIYYYAHIKKFISLLIKNIKIINL